MLPDEIKRLMYQCIMGGDVVVIAPDDKLASENFEELRKAVVEAADELRLSMEKTIKFIIYGQVSEKEPVGIMSELYDIDDVLEVQAYNPLQKPLLRIWRENRNNYRKLHHIPLIHRARCRWRPRESRRRLEVASPGTVVLDEEVE